MPVLLVPVAVGLVLGMLIGGRIDRLGMFRPQHSGLVVLGAAVQGAAGLGPAGWRFPLVVTACSAVGLWLVVNVTDRRCPLRLAFMLMSVGWGLNLAPIVVNGGMPVSPEALEQVGARGGFEVEDGHLYKHVDAGHRTGLDWLGDVIPVRPLRAVISVGDIALGMGIVLLIASAMAGSDPPKSRLNGAVSHLGAAA